MVSVALLIVAILNGGVSVIISKGYNPETGDQVEFGQLFIATFALSLTMTVAILTVALPRALGYEWGFHLQLPMIVIILGASFSSLYAIPTRQTGAWSMLAGALKGFMHYYGAAFFSGEVIGLASGFIICSVMAHYRRDAMSKRLKICR
jgi:hypothetical protein